MGIQSLQELIDSSGKYSSQFTQHLEHTSKKTSNLLLVHADSCLRHFYHDNVDWVCGGQWSELFQCVEKFVRAFRQSDIELVIFFDGSLTHKSLNQWAAKHEFVREVVRDTLSRVIHNNNIPFRTKTRSFVPPGALKTSLRLAFRACDVLVCSSLEDVFKETVLYCKDQNCIGIIGSDANFMFYNLPSYVSIGSTRWLKKILSACKAYNVESLLTDLNLKMTDLPYFAALIGNFELPDSHLSSFYWDLIEEDNPLKKVQENLSSDAVMPPSELRLKCVAKFIHERRDEIKDIEKLAKIVFEKSSKLTVTEGQEKLAEVISYYEDALIVSQTTKEKSGDNQEWSTAGYPTHNESQELSSLQKRYKKSWKFVDKSKQSISSSKKGTSEKINEEDCSNATLEDPEKVLKEGTLEEAAQALEQLERKESEAEINVPNLEVEELNGDKKAEEDTASKVIENDEKPSLDEDNKTDEETTSAAPDVQDENSMPEVLYPREINITPVLSTIEPEVLNIARKRHQSGQMCPEVLNLLTNGEIIMNMTVDDEVSDKRQPIPLIYRPLRQLLYGVLFGAAKETPKQYKQTTKEDKQTTKEDTEEKNNNIENDNKSTGTEDINNDKETEIPKVNGVLEPDEQQKQETFISSIIEKKSETDIKNNDNESNESKDDGNESNDSKDDGNDTFKVQEWCVYGEKSLDVPDLVQPKGMSWGVPPLKKLWFGTDSEDNANRLKAFLSCMKSDTVNMSNTAMVPQRLMLLCCVLRYLIQQDSKQSLLTKCDIDAFLAQALSAHLTTEHNYQNLANIKLNQVDSRCVQLAAIFMSGIENAIIANDACGSPVPWEFCCPWNFFDGKLFHSKWLQCTLTKFSAVDLCDGKPHIAEKLERLRWCITEGLDSKYSIYGLEQTNKFFSPFGAPLTMQQGPLYGVMRPSGAENLPMSARGRSRGPTSKRAVHGSGATLHVAGVPVAHWGGNKAGFGYSKNAPTVLVGGPLSVDVPSDHKRGRGARKGYVNRGRGLLETPFVSPWQQGFGYEDVQNASFQRYMKGVHKVEQVRANLGKMQHQMYNSRTRNQQQQHQQHQPKNHHQGNYVPTGNKPDSYTKNMWLGKGRGQQASSNSSFLPNNSISSTHHHQQPPIGGRGQWLNSVE